MLAAAAPRAARAARVPVRGAPARAGDAGDVRGGRVRLVSLFGEPRREGATRETFEAVWRNTGKPWFEPAHVGAVEFPYGYGRETQERFGTALGLFAHLRKRVEEREFDAALIAAGPLGALLAAAVKRRGGIAIALGGHLQV